MGVKNFIMKKIPFWKMKAKRKYREFVSMLYILQTKIFFARNFDFSYEINMRDNFRIKLK